MQILQNSFGTILRKQFERNVILPMPLQIAGLEFLPSKIILKHCFLVVKIFGALNTTLIFLPENYLL